MRIIIRREPGFQNNQYCILQFTGTFEGSEGQGKSMMHIGSLVQVDPSITKDKSNYVLQMGLLDVSGFEVKNLDETFLHIQTVSQSQQQKILMIKGIVTKKIIFNKRPYTNLDRASELKNLPQKYNIFKR